MMAKIVQGMLLIVKTAAAARRAWTGSNEKLISPDFGSWYSPTPKARKPLYLAVAGDESRRHVVSRGS